MGKRWPLTSQHLSRGSAQWRAQCKHESICSASAARLEFAMALKKFCLNGDAAAATGDGLGVKAFASVSSFFRHKQQHFFSPLSLSRSCWMGAGQKLVAHIECAHSGVSIKTHTPV